MLVDDLAGSEVLALCPQARVVHVGKRGGCQSTPQALSKAAGARGAGGLPGGAAEKVEMFRYLAGRARKSLRWRPLALRSKLSLA